MGVAAERLGRLRARALDAGLDAALVTSDESIAYLTGFRPIQLERFFAVAVTRDGGAVIVPRLDIGQVEGAPAELARVAVEPGSSGMAEAVAALGGPGVIGVEESHLNFARATALQAAGLDLRPAGGLVMELRARKDAQELAAIGAAVAVVSEAMEAMFGALRVGDVEREVNARVESFLRERGAADCHALILFGENAANPHGSPGDRRLAVGDVICADVSACLDGYWGDLTRCATVGPPTAWAAAAWDVVVRAQQAALAAAVVGRTAADVDRAQREIVTAAPGLGACLHGAGHAMGLAIHEPPFLVPGADDRLEDGMVLTIEPGIYQAGTGGLRLEDDIVVREGAPEVIPALDARLREVPV